MFTDLDRTESQLARQRFESSPREILFLADWERALFVHYRVDPARLQPYVPLELDRWEGSAWVSLVAFTQRRLRPRWGGRFSEMLASPQASHEFLNLRTYVRHNGERAIVFLSEWIPNRLALLVGPATYGLPYQWGRLRYRHAHEVNRIEGEVTKGNRSWRYRAALETPSTFEEAGVETLEQFLLERYAAFTHHNGITRRFRIRHEPWPQTAADVTVFDDSLPRTVGPWLLVGPPHAAHYSPGVKNVWISGPERIN